MVTDALTGKTLLGRYRVVMPIGRGGMGTVYLARTEGAAGFAKPVVIKCVHAELLGDPGMVQMFAREARLLSNLHHPGIVNVIDFGRVDGTYVMVLEYVHGYDVGAWSRYRQQTDSPFACDDAVHIAIAVLDTLTYAHGYQRPDGTRLGIVHRDISPGNILVSLDGQVKLADFGIAKAADEAGEYRSKIGTFKGKIAYSAPELLQGSEPAPSADVYSLAVVLLHVLLGENPFKGQSMGETVQRVLTRAPPRLAELRGDVPPELDELLERALAKDPAARYATAAEMAHELRRLRKRDDETCHRQFTGHVREDFDGGLPLLLELDTLFDRDAAWRHEQGGSAMSLSSTPPAMTRHSQEVFDAPTVVTPQTATSQTATTGRPGTRTAAPPERPRRWLGVALAAGGLGVALGATSLYVALRPRAEPLVGGATLLASGQGLAAATAAGPGTSPTATASQDARSDDDDDPSGRIAATLATRQPDLERCFEQHEEPVAGAPEICLRFRLAADGSVRGAELSPAALATTPLGACLLGVARATHFPTLGRDLSFRLPLTAHQAR